MPEKIIRDPVHDVIALRLERASDGLLFRLLAAPELQRLRRVRQLGMASLAYPGADHSRYSHSLGVMETARRMIEQLRRSFYINEESEVITTCAALLHDLGHGPFSHVFERVTGVHHERLTQRVILDPDSHVHRILSEHDKSLPERIVGLLLSRSKRSFYSDILSSQLDADRLDYLLRDNLMTGSRYGGYDLRWMLHALTVDEKSDRLAVSWKGISAVEAYLQSRYHMYRNVYFHKVVRSAEGMVKLALQRAKRLAAQGRLDWPRPQDNVSKALLGQRLSIDDFVDLDDVSILHCFKLWCGCPDQVLAGLCRGLLFRKLYKTIDLSPLDVSRAGEVVSKATSAIELAGGDPAYDLFYDEVNDTPYEKYSPSEGDLRSEILVCDPEGRAVEFASISPIVEALNRELTFRRLHVAPAYRDIVAGVVRD